MTTIGVFEAKTHLPELLQRVAQGESILITRHGKPTALLVPAPEMVEKDVRQVVKDMLAYREQQRRSLGNLTPRDLIEEGRRF